MKWPSFWTRHRAGRYESLGGEEDFLLITWDSCRFDTFEKARKPNLDPFGPARRAWTMGTYTLPAHVAMFQGFLPHVFEPLPFYNRYVQQLWRISHRRIHTRPLVTFPPHTKSIVHGFRQRGYFTAGVAAMYWFRDADVLRDGFEHFTVTGFDARKQNSLLIKQLEMRSGRPFFAFVNYGETHSPFRYEGMPGQTNEVDERFSLGRLFNQQGLRKAEWTLDQEAFGRQVACAEFLDGRMGELIAFLRRRGRPTTIVVCGDHGECLGEEGLFGHAFYHEKVMEVPMLIFRLNAPAHPPPRPMEQGI